MSNTSNFLFLIVPESLFGPLLLLLVVAGGFAVILGFGRLGKGLILTAIALPLVSFAAGALINEVFMALPDWLVTPVAMLLMLVVYLMIGWTLIKMVFGQKAVDEAKGHLLADIIRGTLRMFFTRAGIVASGSALIFLYLSVA